MCSASLLLKILLLLVYSSKRAFASELLEDDVGRNGNGAGNCQILDPQPYTYSCSGYSSLPTNLPDLGLSRSKNQTGLDMADKYNYFERLADGDLLRVNLPDMTILDLGKCGIREIENGAFRGGNEIVKLSLWSNYLTYLDPQVFSDLPKLMELSLSNNPIKRFKFFSGFPKLLNLKELHLFGCQISTIERHDFKNLVNLETLNLRENEIKDLNWIPPFNKLRSLDLQSNQITKPHLGEFSNTPNVGRLLNTPNLISLNFYGNPIKEFTDDAEFPRLPYLETLNLAGCQLKSIKAKNLFKNLKDLQNLDLSRNQLRTLDWKILLPLKSLIAIFLFPNPLHCDCQMRPLLNFLEKRLPPYTRCSSSNANLSSDGNYNLTGKIIKDINREYFICPPVISQLKIFTAPAPVVVGNDSIWGNLNQTKPETSTKASTVILKCHFSGFPVPQVKWLKNAQELQKENGTTERVKISATKPETNLNGEEEKLAEWSNEFIQTLIIKEVDGSDSGEYECFVYSTTGNGSKLVFFDNTLKYPTINLSAATTPTRTFKLKAEIIKFEINSGLFKVKKEAYSLKNFQETKTLTNSGSVAKQEIYEAQDTVVESTKIIEGPFSSRLIPLFPLSTSIDLQMNFTESFKSTLQNYLIGSLDFPPKNRGKLSDEEKNVKEKVRQSLVSFYNSGSQSNSSLQNPFLELERKTFVVIQNVTIPPCTEVEIISHIRTAKEFQVDYLAFFEVSGNYDDDGSQMTGEELKGVFGVDDDADKEQSKVIVKGVGLMDLEFSWYSSTNTEEKPIQGCKG